MQPCKTGDQPYSDASPNGECSLNRHTFGCMPTETTNTNFNLELAESESVARIIGQKTLGVRDKRPMRRNVK